MGNEEMNNKEVDVTEANKKIAQGSTMGAKGLLVPDMGEAERAELIRFLNSVGDEVKHRIKEAEAKEKEINRRVGVGFIMIVVLFTIAVFGIVFKINANG
jgi:hypothetical protein